MKTFILLIVMLSMLPLFATETETQEQETISQNEVDVCRDLTHQSEESLQKNPELVNAISECLAPNTDEKADSSVALKL